MVTCAVSDRVQRKKWIQQLAVPPHRGRRQARVLLQQRQLPQVQRLRQLVQRPVQVQVKAPQAVQAARQAPQQKSLLKTCVNNYQAKTSGNAIKRN